MLGTGFSSPWYSGTWLISYSRVGPEGSRAHDPHLFKQTAATLPSEVCMGLLQSSFEKQVPLLESYKSNGNFLSDREGR